MLASGLDAVADIVPHTLGQVECILLQVHEHGGLADIHGLVHGLEFLVLVP